MKNIRTVAPMIASGEMLVTVQQSTDADGPAILVDLCHHKDGWPNSRTFLLNTAMIGELPPAELCRWIDDALAEWVKYITGELDYGDL